MAFEIFKREDIPQLPRLETPLSGKLHTILKFNKGKIYAIDPSGILKVWNQWEYGASGTTDTDPFGSATWEAKTSAGEAHWLARSNTGEMTFGDSTYSFAGWFFYESGYPLSTRPLWGKRGQLASNREYYFQIVSNLQCRFVIGDGTTETNVQSTEDWERGEWNFVAGGFNSEEDRIWVYTNGTKVTGLYTGTPLSGSNQTFNIGVRGGHYITNAAANSFSGNICMLGQWNRELSQSDLDFLYNGKSGAFSPSGMIGSVRSGCQHFWPLISGYNNWTGYDDTIGSYTLEDGSPLVKTPFTGIIPTLINSSSWILSGGRWDDSGFWDDDAVWID